MLGKVTSILLVLLAVSELTMGQSPHDVTIDIANTLDMKFVNGTSAIQNIALTSSTDLDDGKEKANAAQLQVRTNLNWKLMVSAGFPIFSYFGSVVNPNMPASVLTFRKSGAATYSALSYDTPVELATGSPGDYTDTGHEINVDYLVDSGYDYPAGLYFINVFYTASEQ